jgi:hypothetical protein
MPAILVASDGHQSHVIIRELSAHGFRMEHSDDLQPNEEVKLLLGKGSPILATIKWCIGREAGGAFHEGPLTNLA